MLSDNPKNLSGNRNFQHNQNINEIDLSSLMLNIKNLVFDKNAKVNKQFAQIVASKFEGDFGKYLKNYLVKTAKTTDVFAVINNYLKDKTNVDYYSAVFQLLGMPMLSYFVERTFGKASFGGKIRQMTPFMSKVSTGNSSLDGFIFDALKKSMVDKDNQTKFRAKLKGTLDGKLHDLLDDADYNNLMQSVMKQAEDEQLNEGEFTDSIKNKAKSIRNLFISSEQKYKYQVLDNILEVVPNLKKEIRREIRDVIFNMDYGDIDVILSTFDSDRNSRVHTIPSAASILKVVDIVTNPILEHIIKNSQAIYFNSEVFGDFIEVVKGVFMDTEVVAYVKKNIKNFILIEIRKQKEKTRAKQLKK